MAAALPVEQDLAKQLYLKGLPLSQVARKTGVRLATLSTWKKRGNWVQQKAVHDVTETSAVQQVAAEVSSQAVKICRRIMDGKRPNACQTDQRAD